MSCQNVFVSSYHCSQVKRLVQDAATQVQVKDGRDVAVKQAVLGFIEKAIDVAHHHALRGARGRTLGDSHE